MRAVASKYFNPFGSAIRNPQSNRTPIGPKPASNSQIKLTTAPKPDAKASPQKRKCESLIKRKAAKI